MRPRSARGTTAENRLLGGLMPDESHRNRPPNFAGEIASLAAEAASNAHIDVASLEADEKKFLEEHALKKPLRVPHIWAMGVGAVITGEYFGWNMGLKEGGPIGMLLATVFVCVLYTAWVLALSELAVAMPFAGGPLAYGRRAMGPTMGFIMGWSMFLESLFATIGTAIATGGAVFFMVNLLVPGLDEIAVTTLCGLITVVLFAAIQWIGAAQQAKVMEWMTYGAIVGLIWFWLAAAPGVDLSRIFTSSALIGGWSGFIKAIPFAIWWLVIIESVALAAEEAHEPHLTIPRGMMLAQSTLIVLVLLTWFFVSASTTNYRITAEKPYPLQFVYQEVWPGNEHRWHLVPFAFVALFGMVSSYNGMLYATSRQSFSLGRAGYLPLSLGTLHAQRRTPVASIAFWSLVIAGFVVWGYWNQNAVMVAVLSCNLTALIWYVLAMVCLLLLRVKEPDMQRPYKVPLYPYLPLLVMAMSVFAAVVYAWFYREGFVLWITIGMYAIGLTYYLGYARTRLVRAAPEELAARVAVENE
ncbi:MAG: amino acid permease [Pirellulales bacterium]|nr:amino acid permease [Pirellulales bacterium]